eukprot:7698643-Alexandrium_andersonii.AAC.1
MLVGTVVPWWCVNDAAAGVKADPSPNALDEVVARVAGNLPDVPKDPTSHLSTGITTQDRALAQHQRETTWLRHNATRTLRKLHGFSRLDHSDAP